jgi:hypothetical protein
MNAIGHTHARFSVGTKGILDCEFLPKNAHRTFGAIPHEGANTRQSDHCKSHVLWLTVGGPRLRVVVVVVVEGQGRLRAVCFW